jgi:hypothetical protein
VNRVDNHFDPESLLHDYFRDLDSALSSLPRARRTQLVSEIRQHVDAALTEQPPQSPVEMRNLLDRVGQPEDIAAAALEEEPGQPRRPMRTGQKVLIASVSVLVLAGLGTGLAFALMSQRPSRGAAASGTIPAARRTTTPSVVPTTVAPTTVAATTPVPTSVATTVPPTTVAPTTPSVLPSASLTGGTSALRTVLPPATVPPVKDECTEQLVYDADGNVTPLTCPDGGVNTVAWKHFAVSGAELLRLGLYATPTQVYQAICHDYHTVYGTGPITESAEEIAQAYYQWKFGVNPLSEFEQLGCPKS